MKMSSKNKDDDVFVKAKQLNNDFVLATPHSLNLKIKI